MSLERIADEVVILIDRLVRLVPVLRNREVSVAGCLETLRADLGSLAYDIWQLDLDIVTSLGHADDDQFLLAGVKVDVGGRVRVDDRWVHELFRVRHAIAGYAHRSLREPGWDPKSVLAPGELRDPSPGPRQGSRPPISLQGHPDDDRQRGNAGPPLTADEGKRAAEAGRRHLAAARAAHKDVTQAELLEVMRVASGRQTFSATLFRKVLGKEWDEFREWANPEFRGRRAKVHPAGGLQAEAVVDKQSANPAATAEFADEFRKGLMARELNEEDRNRLKKMSDDKVIALVVEMASQQMDDDQPGVGRDYRSLSRRSRRRASGS